ncbi:MAG: flagellar biosynthesis anti-sigma factor FlgM [Terracidiphilus sp.]|jgi:flagellar biosynthesis anti-sigma factor FlgM
MKIEVNTPPVSLPPVDQGAKKVSTGSPVGTQISTEDRTTLSTGTQSVQSLTTQAMNSSEVRQDKVNALSQAVKSGEYKVDSTETANALIASDEV